MWFGERMKVRFATHTDRLDEIQRVSSRLAARAVTPSNPCWQEHAVAFADRDGFQAFLTAGA